MLPCQVLPYPLHSYTVKVLVIKITKNIYIQYSLILTNYTDYTDPNRGQSCDSKNNRFGLAASLAIAIDEVNTGQYDYTTNLDNFTPKVLFISSDQTKDKNSGYRTCRNY